MDVNGKSLGRAVVRSAGPVRASALGASNLAAMMVRLGFEGAGAVAQSVRAADS